MARATHPIETLTGREREVLRLIAEGKTNPQVAEALGIRFETAKWYVSEVISKLGVASREEAASEWRRYHRLPARLRRVLAVFAGVNLWKVAAAASACVALVVASAVVIAGRGVLPTGEGAVVEEPLVALIGRGPTSSAMPADEAIDIASEQLGFRVLRPRSLPTKANQLVVVNYDLGPEGVATTFRKSELSYMSSTTREVGGQTIPEASLDVLQVPGVSPNGDLTSIAVPGFEIWKETIPPADPALRADPRNTKVVYTAVGEEWSFILVFDGEQPTEAGLEDLLRSLR